MTHFVFYKKDRREYKVYNLKITNAALDMLASICTLRAHSRQQKMEGNWKLLRIWLLQYLPFFLTEKVRYLLNHNN